jgi:uracil-DNA glycosylase
MDPARRHRYLAALGVEAWSLRQVPQPQGHPIQVSAAPPAPTPAATSVREAVAVPAPPAVREPAPTSGQGWGWDSLRAAVAACRQCRLCETRTHTVFGVGPERAPLMVVGEGPGADEDARGEPFVGRAGKLLDEMLRAIGRSRQTNTFIANVVKCLRYNARVQLADGTWERIGRLVAHRYEGDVMSMDASGNLVAAKVVGWHASPLAGRRVFNLTYRSAKNAGLSRSCVQLTGDHPVMTERGWIAVQDLRVGDRVATGQALTELEYDLVCGSLLGDGHVNARSAHFSLAHSTNQADYLLFKAELLARLDCKIDEYQVASGSGEIYPSLHLRTRADRALGILRSQFYDGRKRVPHWLAGGLTPRMLAFWFLDDGHLRVRPPRQPSAEIATCAFTDDDLRVLLQGLANLGLQGRIVRGRIHFSVGATKRLSELIAPFVPPSMRYKLDPEVARTVPFDRGKLAPGPSKVLFDDVEAKPLDLDGPDQTYFCLDVEGTHNFVTAGGVVHNCRPPGNREPAEDEAEACRAYLEGQLQLVQPKLIVALGRVAAQRLLATDTPIGKMRGQTYHWGPQRTPLMVTYHPAYLLRNPSDKAKSWEDLKRIHRFLTA